jgi:hypothetical protein
MFRNYSKYLQAKTYSEEVRRRRDGERERERETYCI